LLRVYHLAKPLTVARFAGLRLCIPRGVFDPRISISTSLVIDFLTRISHRLTKGLALDMGCGTGAIGIFMAKYLGFREVHFFDVDPRALAVTRINIDLNGVSDRAKVLRELNDDVRYDIVVTNPPYLPLRPRDPLDYCWCGGSDLEIFKLMIARGVRLLRRGGFLVTTFSTLSRCAYSYLSTICRKLVIGGSRRTPFDAIYVAICVP